MAKKQSADEREVMKLVYVGPSVPNVVQTNTVYKNGIPGTLKKWIEKYPLFGALLVPVRGISKVRLEMRDAGSEKNLIFHEAEKIIKGGK